MTNDEMRELDAWIRDNIPGTPSNANPTRDPAAAMEVLEKCCEKTCPEIELTTTGLRWVITARRFGSAAIVQGPTLPLAICLFAKELFK